MPHAVNCPGEKAGAGALWTTAGGGVPVESQLSVNAGGGMAGVKGTWRSERGNMAGTTCPRSPLNSTF